MCEPCKNEELDRDYCEETERKVLVRCREGEESGPFDAYRACLLTSRDEQLRVIVFQLAMGVIGGLAYWGVQIRKKKNMTLFERRRLI